MNGAVPGFNAATYLIPDNAQTLFKEIQYWVPIGTNPVGIKAS
jgi:hypothetical protein